MGTHGEELRVIQSFSLWLSVCASINSVCLFVCSEALLQIACATAPLVLSPPSSCIAPGSNPFRFPRAALNGMGWENLCLFCDRVPRSPPPPSILLK